MEDKRRVSILTDSEEGYAQSTKAVGMRPSAGEKLESLLRDGKVLYWEQKFGEANDSFRRAHDIAHQSQTEGSVTAQIASNISACMLQQRDFHGVLEWTEHVLKRDPQNQKALLRRWLALSELGKAEEAGRSLANLEKVPMDDNTRKAVNDHKVALAADEEKQRALRCTNLRKQGNELMAAGEKELAIEKYSAALREDPHNLAASNNRAQAFLDLRRFEQAEKDATVALESDPDNLKASYRRGRARFFRDNPDKRGACMDLTRVVSKDPNNDQAKTLLKQIVESLELDEAAAQRIEGKAVPRRPSLSRGGSGSNPNSHVSFGDGTEPGDDVSTDEERATRDKEVQAMHPDTAKTHWPDPKTRSGLVIVEDDGDGDDDGDSDGCTWCPVVEDKTVEDGGVSHSNWVEAEELRVKGHLEKALEVFTRGAVADPANTLCWIGLARVNRALSNYKRSLEAASRAVRIDPKNRSAVLCSALASLHLDAENLTEDELKVQVQDIHLRLTDMGEDQPELQGPDALELQELDAFIGGS